MSKKKPKKSNQGKKQHSDQRSSVALVPVFEKQFKEDIRWWAKNNKKDEDAQIFTGDKRFLTALAHLQLCGDE